MPKGLGPWAGLSVTVPCGRCKACKIERSKQWATRIMHELKMHHGVGCFVTLTYDDEHLVDELVKEHWQNFAKKMRRDVGPFRYFHCGEYGGLGRPHYHGAVIGQAFAADAVKFKLTKRGDQLWKSKTLSNCWPHGFANFGALTYRSAGYIARYTLKKKGGKANHEHGTRQPPYVTMSLKPGIGHTWLEKWQDEVYDTDYLVIDGTKRRPPKYYDRVLERNDPELLAKIKADRLSRQREHRDDNTPRRLETKEKVLDGKLSLLRRDL